jgi:hypothetical protein
MDEEQKVRGGIGKESPAIVSLFDIGFQEMMHA